MTDLSLARDLLMEMLDEVDVESTTVKKMRKMLRKRMGVKFSKEEKKSIETLIQNALVEYCQKSNASDKENEKIESQAEDDTETSGKNDEDQENKIAHSESSEIKESVPAQQDKDEEEEDKDEEEEKTDKEATNRDNREEEETKYDDSTEALSSNFLSRYKEDSEDDEKDTNEEFDGRAKRLSSNFLSRYKEDSEEEEEEEKGRSKSTKKTRRQKRRKKLESDEEDNVEEGSSEDNYVDEDDFIVKDDDEDWNPDDDGDYTEDEDDDGKKKKGKKKKKKREKKEEKIAGKRTGKRIQVSSKSVSTMHDPIAILADMSDEDEEKDNDLEDVKDRDEDENFVDEEDQLAAYYMEERQREDREVLGIRGVAHQTERERFRQRGNEEHDADDIDVEMKNHETRGSEKRKRDEVRKAKMAEQCSEKLDTFLEKLKARKKRKHNSNMDEDDDVSSTAESMKKSKKKRKKKKNKSLLVILPQVAASKKETSMTNEITATPSMPIFPKDEPSQSLYEDDNVETQALTQTQDVEMTQPLFQYTQSEMPQEDDEMIPQDDETETTPQEDDEMIPQDDETETMPQEDDEMIPPTQIVSSAQDVSPTQIIDEEASPSKDIVDSNKPVSLFEQVMQKRNNRDVSVRRYGKKREIVEEKHVEKEEVKQSSGLEPSTGSNFAFAQKETQQESQDPPYDQDVEQDTKLKLLDDEAEDEEEDKIQDTHGMETQQEEGDLSFVVNNQEEYETLGGASERHVAMMMNMGSTQEIEEDLESQKDEETDISLAQDTQCEEEEEKKKQVEEECEEKISENELARQQTEIEEMEARKQAFKDQEEEEAQQAQWFKERARLQRKLRELQPQTSVLSSFVDDDEESQHILGLLERNCQSRMSNRDDETTTPPLNVVRSGSRRKGMSAKMSRTFSFRRAYSDGNASNSSSAFNAQHSNSGVVAAATTASRSFIFVQKDTSEVDVENEKEVSGIRKRPCSALSSGGPSKKRRGQKTRSLFSSLSINRFSKKPLRSKSS